ncbi:zinc finger protein 668-like [Cydia pomonella]|uniref:zinc finger protein 668-like n=1 Tax=Cydia pomonella TaxID=82600 RepID=UPI002ADD33C6|nr:zinc finger protein 668-like [Cydia pomonella]
MTCDVCLAVLHPPGSLAAHMFRHLTRSPACITHSGQRDVRRVPGRAASPRQPRGAHVPTPHQVTSSFCIGAQRVLHTVGSVTCDVCLAVLHPPGSLAAHMFRHLTRYECMKCDARYPTYDDTLHHYKKQHGDNCLRCAECHYTTDSPQKFRKHKRQHHKRFTCADCGVVLATRPSLTRHMAVLHNKRLYRCVHCAITLTDGATFAAHMRAHGAAAARAACAPCGLQFKAWHAYNAHVLYSTAHRNPRKIACNHCGMKFATATHLRMHVQFSDHPKQTFHCPDCPKEFAVEAEMKQHRNIHKKQRLKSTDRICDYCGRVYTSREHLIRHIQTHLQKRQQAKERAKSAKPHKAK